MSCGMRRLLYSLATLAAALMASQAGAQDVSADGAPEFALGIGYANVSLGDSSVIDSESALRFEPTLSFSPIQQLPQLRLGANVGVTMVLDNSTRTIISGDSAFLASGRLSWTNRTAPWDSSETSAISRPPVEGYS